MMARNSRIYKAIKKKTLPCNKLWCGRLSHIFRSTSAGLTGSGELCCDPEGDPFWPLGDPWSDPGRALWWLRSKRTSGFGGRSGTLGEPRGEWRSYNIDLGGSPLLRTFTGLWPLTSVSLPAVVVDRPSPGQWFPETWPYVWGSTKINQNNHMHYTWKKG